MLPPLNNKMEFELFKKKFEIIKKYEYEMTGISIGLGVLRRFNIDKYKLSENLESGVLFYDFIDYQTYKYSLRDLNISMRQIYNQNILYDKIILYNKLYWIFCDCFNNLYKIYNYSYYKNIYNMYDVINKFFHGLRTKNTSNPLKFYVHEIMTIYTIRYFDEKVSFDEFYMFMCDLILELCEKNVLSYNRLDNSIVFNSDHYNDLIELVNLSFNLMTLGNNNIYNSYDLSQDNIETKLDKFLDDYKISNNENKKYIDDLLTCLVISSSVTKICAESNINNIFIEAINFAN